MNGPVELRFFARVFTLQHLEQGFQPQRASNGRMYTQPELQYRCKRRVHEGGEVRLIWGDWLPVKLQHEDGAAFQISAVSPPSDPPPAA